ncbi:MAG: glycine cleavage system protein GcvH [Bacillota bacterium]|nr:glycine cleavage system protein GcvH [Bacillota bacterium]
METRNDLLYSKDHEWVKVEETQARIGISDYAQDSLGAVVFIELPAMGAELSAGDVLGVVESVKAASEVYTPLSGKVVAINNELDDAPEAINEQSYEQWIAVLELSDPNELKALMDEAAYLAYCAEEES